jgi:hypothetical protein
MSESIEDLFDRYVDRLVSGDDVSSFVVDAPDLAEMLSPLLSTSELVARQLKMVEPTPRFRVSARTRMRGLFFARLARKESGTSFLSLWWQRRWATAMATAMVVCLAGLGVLAASFNALPSGFFYPVKMTTEEMRLALTTSEYERAELRLEYADRRLSEMTSMADKGDAEMAVLLAGEVTRLIIQLATSTVFDLPDAGNGQALVLPDSSSAPLAPIAILAADRADALALLDDVLQSAPEGLRPDVEHLMNELSREFDTTISYLETRTAS